MPLSQLRNDFPTLPTLFFGKLQRDLDVVLEWVENNKPASTTLRSDWVPRGLGVGADGTVCVWDRKEWNESCVSWQEGTRILHLEDDGLTLELTVEHAVAVQRVCREGFWPEKLPCIETKLPDYPVRMEHWALVAGPAERLPDLDGRVGWRIPFKGGMTLENWWGRTALEDVSTGTPCFAVWPPKIIPGWQIYSVLLQGWKSEYRPAFWVGQAAEVPGRPLAQHEVRPDLAQRTIGFVLDKPDPHKGAAPAVGPRFVAFHAAEERCGFFELLAESYGAAEVTGTSPLTVVLDFGTSNTVLAAMQYDDLQNRTRGKAIDLLRHLADDRDAVKAERRAQYDRELLAPRIIAGEPRLDQPWLPGLFTNNFEAQVDTVEQVPSGIFLRSSGRSDDDRAILTQESIPFVDFTIVGPGLAVEKNFDTAMRCWHSGLKWSDDDLASRKFLEALFVWLAAVVRRRRMNLRATFPLAFSNTRRTAYGNILRDTIERVKNWTGTEISLAEPYYGRPKRMERDTLPFIDEASPLILNRYQDFTLQDRQNATLDPKFLFVADLGGGTLDVLLGYFFGENAFRIVTAESVRIGARDVIDLLLRRLTGVTDEKREFHRALLEGLARQGRLEGIIEEGSHDGAPFSRRDGFDLEWQGDARHSANEFIGDLALYFLFLLEYASRFVAGTLTQPHLVERIRRKNTPGDGRTPEELPGLTDGTPPQRFALSIVLTGNGWNFLGLLDDGEARWTDSLRGRIKALTGADEVRHVVPDFAGAQRKLLTAERTAEIGSRDGARESSGTRLDVEVAPNGFADYCINGNERVEYSWGSLVGYGWEKAHNDNADGCSSLPAAQISYPSDPPFPPKTTAWLTRDPHRARYEQEWLLRSKSNEELNRLRQRQNNMTRGDGRRLLSTARAVWEDIVRDALRLPRNVER